MKRNLTLLILVFLTPLIAQAQLVNALLDTAELKSGTYLLWKWEAQDANGEDQCSGNTDLIRGVPFGVWSVPGIGMDMDRRPGGCSLQLGILDLDKRLDDLILQVRNKPDHPEPEHIQCPDVEYTIPIATRPAKDLQMTAPIIFDNDERKGGCTMSFQVSGRDDLAFEVSFVPWPTTDGQGKLISNVSIDTKPASIWVDTDGREGGWSLRMRLRERLPYDSGSSED